MTGAVKLGSKEIHFSLTSKLVLNKSLFVRFSLIVVLSVLVAEVTQPSLGVGYELGRAVTFGTPILCLFRTSSDRRKFT